MREQVFSLANAICAALDFPSAFRFSSLLHVRIRKALFRHSHEGLVLEKAALSRPWALVLYRK
jgi:hypothetical protein